MPLWSLQIKDTSPNANLGKAERLVELHIKYNKKIQGKSFSGMGNDEEDAANAAYLERLVGLGSGLGSSQNCV